MQITKNMEQKAIMPKNASRPFSAQFISRVVSESIVDFHKSHRVGDGYPPSLVCPIGKVNYGNLARIKQYCQQSKVCTFTKSVTHYNLDLTPGISIDAYYDYPSAAIEALTNLNMKFSNVDPSFSNCGVAH